MFTGGWGGWMCGWCDKPAWEPEGALITPPEGPVGITINIQPPPTALPLYEPRKVIYRLCWLLSYQPEYASWTPKVPNNTPKLRVLSPSGQLIPGKRQSDQTHSTRRRTGRLGGRQLSNTELANQTIAPLGAPCVRGIWIPLSPPAPPEAVAEVPPLSSPRVQPVFSSAQTDSLKFRKLLQTCNI